MSEPLSGDSRQPYAETQAIQRIYLPVAARGMGGDAVPERTMLPGNPELPFWREMSGFAIGEGFLRDAGRISDHGDTTITPPTLDAIEQIGLDLYIRKFSGTTYTILVTTEEIWHSDDSGANWRSLTPVYNEGDVNVENGSDKVFGTGNNCKWQTRGHIRPGQAFGVVDTAAGNVSTWYEIESVDDEKELTLTTNYTGPTKNGEDYKIRHNFRATGGLVLSTIFNNDLVVAYASNILGDNSDDFPVATKKISAVCQVENIYQASPDPARFLVGNVRFFDSDATGGDVDLLSEMAHITGLEMHTDGRVMISALTLHTGTSSDPGTGETGNRLYYSSNADRFQWDREPAGFVDLVGINGSITGGLHRYGEQIVIHFDNGIMVGFESGLSDPPLNYEIMPLATRGATHPRAVRNTPVGQIFPSFGLNSDDVPQVYVFDGASITPIADPIRHELDGIQKRNDPPRNGDVWAHVSHRDGVYHLWLAETAFLGNQSYEYAYNWRKDQWSRSRWGENIYGFSSEDSVQFLGGEARKFLSNRSSSLTDWFRWRHSTPTVTTDGGLRGDVPILYSEWLDGNRPGFNKAWTQVMLWVSMGNTGFTNVPIRCQLVARDSHASGAGDVSPGRVSSVQEILVSWDTDERAPLLQFSFAPFVAEAVQVRLTLDPDNDGLQVPDILHMALDFQLLDQVEASGLTSVSADSS